MYNENVSRVCDLDQTLCNVMPVKCSRLFHLLLIIVTFTKNKLSKKERHFNFKCKFNYYFLFVLSNQ